MALKLSVSTKPPQFLPGKPKFHPHLLIENVQLNSFVGQKSWLMFGKLGANGQWLTSNPETWEEDSEYCTISNFLKDLKVVNEFA